MKNAGKPVLRFATYRWVAVLHLLLLVGVFALFMGRKPGALQSEAILDVVSGFYSHISNFSLSYLLLAGVGFLWLLMDVSVRHLALAAFALVVANVACELLLSLLNTRDPMDAVYGVAGTLLAFAWLWIIWRFGLKPLPDESRG